jgi:hypothetical protein
MIFEAQIVSNKSYTLRHNAFHAQHDFRDYHGFEIIIQTPAQPPEMLCQYTLKITGI